MAITACTNNEYVIYTGGTETPHAIYTEADGTESIQCTTVKLGGNGLYN